MWANKAILLATLSEQPYKELPEELKTTVEIQLDSSFDACTFYESELPKHPTVIGRSLSLVRPPSSIILGTRVKWY